MKIYEFLEMLTDKYQNDYLEVVKGDKVLAFGSMNCDDDDWWAKSKTKTSVRIRKINWSEIIKIEFKKERVITGDGDYGYEDKEVKLIKITT